MPRLLLMIACVLVPIVAIAPARADKGAPGEAIYSQLWGESGDQWSADSRLPDFSYAGYHRGEKPLPTVKPEASVRDYGAVGDGETDDTDAFRRAFAEAAGRVIAVPAGRYVITGFVHIERSGTVLLGEGPDRSVLFFPRPLEEVKPNPGATTTGRPTSNYSWSDGFLRVRGRLADEPIAEVIEPAPRGATQLVVDHAERFRPGQDIRLRMQDTPDNSLTKHFYADDSGPVDNLNGRQVGNFLSRVTAVDADTSTITFDRPLRTDVQLKWQPRLSDASSKVEEVGVEGLAFEFPVTPYRGHFSELGFNALALANVRNCWVRNIVIRNADSGIYVTADNVTLTGIVIESDRPADSRGNTGHHGVTLGRTDCVLTDFDLRTRFIHDITVTRGSAGNVTMNGKAVDLALDHHRYGPHANLWTNLDAGEGSRLFHSGGGAQLGWHCGAWTTFWNIRSRRDQRWPQVTYGGGKWSCDLINLVALPADQPALREPDGRWFEPADPDQIHPQNLYEAQLHRRLGR